MKKIIVITLISFSTHQLFGAAESRVSQDKLFQYAQKGIVSQLGTSIDLNPSHLRAKDKGQTLLAVSVRAGHADAVELLLNKNADPSVPIPIDITQGISGQSIFGNAAHIAAGCGHANVLRQLLQTRKIHLPTQTYVGDNDSSQEEKHASVNDAPYDERVEATILHIAAREGNPECITVALEAASSAQSELRVLDPHLVKRFLGMQNKNKKSAEELAIDQIEKREKSPPLDQTSAQRMRVIATYSQISSMLARAYLEADQQNQKEDPKTTPAAADSRGEQDRQQGESFARTQRLKAESVTSA